MRWFSIELQEVLDKINAGREQVEAPFVFCLWRDPNLYDEYYRLNTGEDESIQSEDAKFYFCLGRALYELGYRTFDSITINTYLSNKDTLRHEFDKRGGYREVEHLKSLVNVDNVDGYFDKITKLNLLSGLCTQFFKNFSNTTRFDKM